MKAHEALAQAFEHFINDSIEEWPVIVIKIQGYENETLTVIELEFAQLKDNSYTFESGSRTTYEGDTQLKKVDYREGDI